MDIDNKKDLDSVKTVVNEEICLNCLRFFSDKKSLNNHLIQFHGKCNIETIYDYSFKEFLNNLDKNTNKEGCHEIPNIKIKNLVNRNLIDNNLSNRNLVNRNLTNNNLTNNNLTNNNLTNNNLSNRNLVNRNLVNNLSNNKPIINKEIDKNLINIKLTDIKKNKKKGYKPIQIVNLTDKQFDILKNSKKLTCPFCHFQYGNLFNIKRHIISVHRISTKNIPLHRCIFCKDCFTKKSHLHDHFTMKHNSKRVYEDDIFCIPCNKFFKTEIDLLKHNKFSHS